MDAPMRRALADLCSQLMYTEYLITSDQLADPDVLLPCKKAIEYAVREILKQEYPVGEFDPLDHDYVNTRKWLNLATNTERRA